MMSCRPRVIQSLFSVTYCYYDAIPAGRVCLYVGAALCSSVMVLLIMNDDRYYQVYDDVPTMH